MKTKEDILKEKSGIYQFTNGWTFEDDQNLIKAIHEAMDEYAAQFRLFDVCGSLHYDEKLLIDLWYKRNPCHELNSDSGEDMFWKTAFMVFEDYVREVSRNDR